jgi:hypothetical protein
VIEATDFLEEVAGFTKSQPGPTPSADRPVRLATVTSLYTSGLVRVRFDGETILGTKGYASLSSYNPQPDDRVALIPVGSSYLIIGKVDPSPRQFPKWQSLATALRNNWTAYQSNVFQATPEIIRSSDGWVKVKGLVAGGTATDGTTIAILPAGYRPTGQLHFATVSSPDDQPGTDRPALVRVRPDGAILAGFGVGPGWVSLDSITFVAES